MRRLIEWVAIAIVGLAVAVGVIVLLSGGLAGTHDDPGLTLRSGPVPGTSYRDLGDAHLAPGARRPVYDSSPPTSGAHVPVAIRRPGGVISDDQLLQALSLGDVVFLYSTTAPPRGLQAVADEVAPRFTARLAAEGQAVILARRPGLRQITALAWTRMLRSDDAVALRTFAAHWLGRGAGARAQSVAGSS